MYNKCLNKKMCDGLKKIECSICGKDKNISKFEKGYICSDCIKVIAKL